MLATYDHHVVCYEATVPSIDYTDSSPRQFAHWRRSAYLILALQYELYI
jgi:hypothetical protein